jgi:predicted nucleotidyltransferase
MAEYSGFEKIYDIIAIINLIIPVCLKIKNVVSMNYRQDLNQQMNNTLSRNEIISLIKAEKPFLKENFGVIHIGIFGSYAKDRQTIDSDIDFLVEFEEPRFDWIAGLI